MDYITFVLGYDLLHDYFEMFEDAPCDVVYEVCEEIAREFNMFDMEHPKACAMYEALQDWLGNHMEFVWDCFERLGPMKKCYEKDAIFKPGKIHGCEDELYILYLNPDSSVPSWEILHIHREAIHDAQWLFPKALEDREWAEHFLQFLFSGAEAYWDDDLPQYSREYFNADFFDTGDFFDEVKFIINWATEVQND